MPRSSIYQPGHWKRQFPHLAMWCELHPESAYGRSYAVSGFLSAARTSRLATYLNTDGGDPYAPAAAWEAQEIPNGDYVLNATDDRTFEYRVHLVARGVLAGQRIIKYRHSDGIFRGFGFITRTGTFALWRRFGYAGSHDYVRFARAMVNGRLWESCYPFLPENVSDVSISRRCAQCNAAIGLDFPDLRVSAFCETHREWIASESEEGDDEDDARPSRRRTSIEPPLDELGTGQIL